MRKVAILGGAHSRLRLDDTNPPQASGSPDSAVIDLLPSGRTVTGQISSEFIHFGWNGTNRPARLSSGPAELYVTSGKNVREFDYVETLNENFEISPIRSMVTGHRLALADDIRQFDQISCRINRGGCRSVHPFPPVWVTGASRLSKTTLPNPISLSVSSL